MLKDNKTYAEEVAATFSQNGFTAAADKIMRDFVSIKILGVYRATIIVQIGKKSETLKA